MKLKTIAAAVLCAGAVFPVTAQTIRADQETFRALYKELVETNTTLSAGSCTDAAAKMGARLKAADFAAGDITYFPSTRRKAGWWRF